MDEKFPLSLSGETSFAARSTGEQYSEVQRKARQLRRSLRVLENYSPHLLDALERARLHHDTVKVAVEGHEHLPQLALGRLSCSHAYGVTVSFVRLLEHLTVN